MISASELSNVRNLIKTFK